MIKRVILSSFIFICFCSFAQRQRVDSLWKLWNNPSKHDTVRLKALNRLIWTGYMYSQPDSAFYFAQLHYDFAVKKNLKKYQSAALNSQGIACHLQGDVKKGIAYSLRSLKIREEIGDKYGIAMSLNNIGGMYQEEGDYAKSIDYYTKSLKIKEEINDQDGVAQTLGNIGLIYYYQNDLEKAIEYSAKSLGIFEKVGNKSGVATALNSLAGFYEDKNDTAIAMRYYFRALKIREDLGDKNGMASCYNNIGYMFANQHQNAKALEYHERGLKINRESGDKSGEAIALSNISSVYKNLGDYKTSISYGEKALALAKEAGDIIGIKNAGDILFKSYSKINNYQDAFKMHILYTQMKDSVQSEESKSEVLKKDLQYNYDKETALSEKEHEKEIAIAGEQQKKQKVISFFIAGGLILVLFFTFFVINRLRITKRQKLIIEKQKKLVEEQKHEVEIQKQEAEHQKELVQEKQQEIIDSITYAKRLQTAILPPASYINQFLPDNFVLYKPKDIVAGDFYWMETISNSNGDNKEELIFIAAADSTGHGVPGAMVSIVCSNALNKALKEFGRTKTGHILDKTTDLVLETFSKSGEEIKDGMDISLLCIDKQNKKIYWSGANNQLWYIFDNKLTEVKADKQPIGKSDKRQPFTTHEIDWKTGTTFYLMSDGLPDQFGGPKGKKFKYKQLEEILLSVNNESLNFQSEILNQKFEDWKGELEQVDDVLLIGIKV